MISVPDARAKLDDARWKLSEALKDAAAQCPHAGALIANIAQAHRHVVDLIEAAPFKGPFAESQL